MENVISKKRYNIYTLIFILMVNLFSSDISQRVPGTALVLSGGGMRGMAHVGVLRRLEEENIKIDMIAGASMGALVGALYSLGYDSYEIEMFFKNTEMKELFTNKPQRDKTKNYIKKTSDRSVIELDLTSEGIKLPNALNNGQVILNELSKLVNRSPYCNTDFDRLKYKLRIVCTDIQNAQKVVYSKGEIPKLILGSIAFPGLFRPVAYENRKLLDGGLTDNIPVDVAKGYDLIITSNTTNDTKAQDKDYNFIELLDRISVTMTQSNIQENLERSDIVITPELQDVDLNDIDNADSLITLGYNAADKVINDILKSSQKIEIRPKSIVPSSYNISGNTKFDTDSLLAWISKDHKLQSIEQKVLKIYTNSGFILADVSVITDKFPIEIMLDEGIVKNIQIKGNSKTATNFILEQLSIKVGNILEEADLITSIEELYGTDLFYNVSYSLDKKQDCVCIKVEEKPYNVLRIGGCYKTDKGYLGMFELANKNLQGRRAELYLSLLYGEKLNRIEASYYNMFMRRSTLFYEFQPYYQVQEKNIYKNHELVDSLKYFDRRAGVDLNLGFQIFNNYQGMFNAKTEFMNLESVETYRTTIGLRILADSRDDHIVPTKGVHFSFRMEKGWLDNNEDISYHKSFGEFSVFGNMNHRYFFGIGLLGGTADKLIPFMERYYIGGMNDMPGTFFEEYTAIQFLRLKIDQNFLLYSDQIFDIYYRLGYYLNGFWNDPELEWNNRDFINSFYIGMLMNTVVGPAEVGWGITTGNAEIETNSRFYISFGYQLQK